MEDKLNRLKDSMDRTVLKNGRMTHHEKEKILRKAKEVDILADSFLAPILSFVFTLAFFSGIGYLVYSRLVFSQDGSQGGYVLMSIEQLFVWVVIFIFAVAGTVFLFANRKYKLFKTYVVLFPTGLVAAITLVIFNSGDPITPVDQANATQLTEPKVVEEPKSLDRIIRDSIYGEMDVMSDINERRIEDLQISVDEKVVSLVLGADGIGTMDEIRSKLLEDVESAAKLLFENEQVEVGKFQWKIQHFPNPTGEAGVGERKYEVGLTYTITRESFEKMDWKTFSFDELEQAALEYEMRPFLSAN